MGDILCKCLCCCVFEEIYVYFFCKLIIDVLDDLNVCFIYYYNIIYYYYRVSDFVVISDNIVVIWVVKDGIL